MPNTKPENVEPDAEERDIETFNTIKVPEPIASASRSYIKDKFSNKTSLVCQALKMFLESEGYLEKEGD